MCELGECKYLVKPESILGVGLGQRGNPMREIQGTG